MKHTVTIERDVEITVKDGSDAITRITGPDGDEWRSSMYGDIHTENDVLQHWAWNAIQNGVMDASRLDGWADLPAGEVEFRLV